ncbi:hypothetical protein KW787_04215 [Candidatus Pacearchaeota archaeon]|nr:hypothetical protein [Candidatus Pacearchaeota archaeon]
MALKACKQCKRIHDHAQCPSCGSDQSTDTFKGKVVILKPEESEIAKNLKIKEKGTFAVKLG